MASEVVRSRVHELPEVLFEERRVELRGPDVGGLFIRTETVQGAKLYKQFLPNSSVFLIGLCVILIT